jgi:hypothetical protein
VNIIKADYIHLWTCHNKTHYFMQLWCANKSKTKTVALNHYQSGTMSTMKTSSIFENHDIIDTKSLQDKNLQQTQHGKEYLLLINLWHLIFTKKSTVNLVLNIQRLKVFFLNSEEQIKMCFQTIHSTYWKLPITIQKVNAFLLKFQFFPNWYIE